LVARLISIGTSLALIVITSRQLGPEGKGKYSLVVAAIALLTQVSNLGLGTANLLYVARRPARFVRLLRASLIFSALATAVFVTALGLYFHLAGTSGRDTLVNAGVLGIAAGSSLLWLITQNLLIGAQQTSLYNAATITYSVVLLVSVGIVAWRQTVSIPALAGTVLLANVSALLLMLRVRSPIPGPRNRHSMGYRAFRSLLQYGMKVYAAQLASFLMARSEIFLAARFFSIKTLGIYTLLCDMCNVLAQLQATVNLVYFRDRAAEQVRSRQNRTTRMYVWLTVVSYLVLLPPVVLLAPWAIQRIFGSAFSPAASALRYALPGAMLIGLASIFQNRLGATGRPLAMMIPPIAGFVTSVALNLALMPRYGISGGAMTYLVSGTVMLIVVVTLNHAKRPA
jgi:O-antigen/teichoic acid export membrane protein